MIIYALFTPTPGDGKVKTTPLAEVLAGISLSVTSESA